MNTLDDILKLDPNEIDARWPDIDKIVFALPTSQEQIAAWNALADVLKPHTISRGMPFFRLGHLHLLHDAEAKRALDYLRLAYEEDARYAPETGRTAHRMGAYRLLGLSQGFIEYLEAKKNWEAPQLAPAYRQLLMKTLLAVYDRSLLHILDVEGHTYQSFFALIQDKELTRFAIENYFFAERLIQMFYISGAHISRFTDEYPLSRSVVALYGGVLEAILADRLPDTKGDTLGVLLAKAIESGTIKVGDKLSCLSSLMLYLRNHIHADRDAERTPYFIDINVAKGCKAAVDWVMADLLSGMPSLTSSQSAHP